MAACDQLDRIGDQFAADQRGLHALGAGGDAVIDRDRVDLQRCTAGGTNAVHHALREFAMVQVAWHRADPAVGNANLRLLQIFIGEAGSLHHPARNGAIRTIEQRGALVPWVG